MFSEDRIRTNLGQENMHYDAFLLFADEDYEFACKMVDYLETECQMKVKLIENKLSNAKKRMNNYIICLNFSFVSKTEISCLD